MLPDFDLIRPISELLIVRDDSRRELSAEENDIVAKCLHVAFDAVRE
jgi:hypothetical protein